MIAIKITDFLPTDCPAEIDRTPNPKAKISVIQVYGKVNIIFETHMNNSTIAIIKKYFFSVMVPRVTELRKKPAQ